MEFEVSEGISRKMVSAYGENVKFVKQADGKYHDKTNGLYHNGKKILDSLTLSINKMPLTKATKATAKLWGIKQLFSLKGVEVERSILPRKDSYLDILHVTNTSGKKQNTTLEISLVLTKQKTYHRRIFDHLRQTLTIEEEGTHIVLGIGRVEKESDISHPYKNDRLLHHLHKVHKDKDVEGYKIALTLEPSESIHIPFIVALSDKSSESAFDVFDKLYADWKGLQLESIQSHHVLEKIDTPSLALNRAFTWSVHLLDQLPKHSFHLSRQDILWTSQALLDLGRYGESRKLVEKLQDKDPLLFYFATANLVSRMDDQELLKRFEPLLTEAKRNCVIEDYLVHADEDGPTIESPNWLASHIEQQSLWSEALKTTYMRTSYLLKRELQRKFWDEESNIFYSRSLDDKKTSAEHIDSRFLLPLAFGQIDLSVAHKALDELKRNYISLHGVTLKSKESKGARYLKETSYSTLTGLAACAFFQYGRFDDGIHMLLDLAAHTDKNHSGHIAESHALKDGTPLGEMANVAAHALLVHAIDTYLFGMQIRGNKISLHPKMPSDWHEMKRKHKVSDDRHISFLLRRNGSGFEGEIKVHGTGNSVVELALPEHVKEINVNGKVQKGNKILFKPDEVNLFVAKA